jgi:hypothetical protein
VSDPIQPAGREAYRDADQVVNRFAIHGYLPLPFDWPEIIFKQNNRRSQRRTERFVVRYATGGNHAISTNNVPETGGPAVELHVNIPGLDLVALYSGRLQASAIFWVVGSP